jgi:hypothetical protein
MSFNRDDAALSFCAYFAELSDEDILGEQWDYEQLADIRLQAQAILDRED